MRKMVEKVVGFDAGSTACKLFDGDKFLLIDSVMAEEPLQARSLDAGDFLEERRVMPSEGITLKVRRSEIGPTYLLGEGAHEGHNPRSLADGAKDDADVQLFLDAGLATLEPEAQEIRAKVVSHCPINEYLEGVTGPSLKTLLEGHRTRWISGRKVEIHVEVLEIGPEAIAALYFLAARRELRTGNGYMVLDFGGRTLDAAYVLKGLLQSRYSRHFEGGLDGALVDAVAGYLARNGVHGVDRSRIRGAIANGSNEYQTEHQQVFHFGSFLEEAEEEYAQAKLKDISALWRGVPAEQVIIQGGAATPAIMSKLLQQYPKATVIPQALARHANAMGLYYRAVKLIERSKKTKEAVSA